MTPIRPRRTSGSLAAAVFIVLVLAAGPATAHAAKPRPDLAVNAVSSLPTTATTGAAFTVSDTTLNGGRARSRASNTGYYLSLDAKKSKSDLRAGTRKVKALRPGKSSKGAVKLTIGTLVAPGTYRLIACADIGGQVRERSERNNCLAAKGAVAVTRPPTFAGPAVPAPNALGPNVPSASIADATVTEGHSGTATAVFAVTLSGATTVPVTVGFATADGSATAPGDYVAQSGTVTFAAGETEKSVAVAVNGDARIEPTESLALNLSAPTGATITDGQATGTITNDDASATLQMTEINPEVTGDQDLLELRVVTGGSLESIAVARNPTASSGGSKLAQLPAVNVATGDVVVIHFQDTNTVDESSSKAECTRTAPSCYPGAWDFGATGTGQFFYENQDAVYAVVAPNGATQDAVPFEADLVTGSDAFYGSLQWAQAQGFWTPTDCGGVACTSSSTPTGEAISVETDGVGGIVEINSVRLASQPGDQRSDWIVGPSTWGEVE